MSSSGSTSIYGILYKIDEPYASQMCAQSSALNEFESSGIVLAPDVCFPHITVVHIKGNLESATAIWYEFADVDIKPSTTFDVGDFYVHESNGGVSAGFEITAFRELVELHMNLVKLCDLHSVEIVSETRDRYWPHITLSHWREMPAKKIPEFTFQEKMIAGTLVLSEMGVHGTAIEAIND